MRLTHYEESAKICVQSGNYTRRAEMTNPRAARHAAIAAYVRELITDVAMSDVPIEEAKDAVDSLIRDLVLEDALDALDELMSNQEQA
jgi:hypothetical protein